MLFYLRRKRRFQNPYKSLKHSTPLALWRGVGGEAFFSSPRGGWVGALGSRGCGEAFLLPRHQRGRKGKTIL